MTCQQTAELDSHSSSAVYSFYDLGKECSMSLKTFSSGEKMYMSYKAMGRVNKNTCKGS